MKQTTKHVDVDHGNAILFFYP